MADAGGRAAEHQVARLYEAQGHRLVAARWRGQGGEIDLIFDAPPALIFVEVKRARTHDLALHRLAEHPRHRLFSAVAEYHALQAVPQECICRIDAALVDGTGRIKILENAFV
ncbi:YraN family protein [Palleronia caenipelagi]|nr:YraN family protein [Palleronia caenipelagi]